MVGCGCSIVSQPCCSANHLNLCSPAWLACLALTAQAGARMRAPDCFSAPVDGRCRKLTAGLEHPLEGIGQLPAGYYLTAQKTCLPCKGSCGRCSPRNPAQCETGHPAGSTFANCNCPSNCPSLPATLQSSFWQLPHPASRCPANLTSLVVFSMFRH